MILSSQHFFQKNEQTNSTLLLVDLFSFVFWKKVMKATKKHFGIDWPLTIMIVPITDYAQSANSPSALRNRLLKYLIPVILISFLFNGPKFFEARVGYSNSTVLATSTNETLTNLTLSDGTMNTVLEQESIEWTPYVSKGGSDYLTKVCYKWMSLYNCPLYDHFWPFSCHMCVYLSQNWGFDGHCEVLNRSYLWLVEKLWCTTQIFPFLFFLRFCTKQIFASFLFFTFLCFLS